MGVEPRAHPASVTAFLEACDLFAGLDETVRARLAPEWEPPDQPRLSSRHAIRASRDCAAAVPCFGTPPPVYLQAQYDLEVESDRLGERLDRQVIARVG